ncbi:MAG: dihydroorotate dehydrogenase-like protein [Planctomycetes bacterium]|nr:dihydroorotate dehydrogenase-like protein [Planctomycetota bacterium]
MSVDLRTRYLGFELSGPLVASASPMTGTLAGLRAVQQAGASMAVMPSLFEEQIEHEELSLQALREYGSESFAEALDYRPAPDGYPLGPEAYLDVLRRARAELAIPVCASLNGCTAGGWAHYAHELEQAGASALELNVYVVSTDLDTSGAELERRMLDLVAIVRAAVRLPLAVKIGPGFSAPAHMARRLVEVGADGLVLFNRYLRPDIDLEKLELVPSLVLSDSYDSRIPLQWIGILRGKLAASLAASSGVHTAEDALKLLMVGADAVMATSSVLKQGPAHFTRMQAGIRTWMEQHGYASIEQLKGSLSRENCPDPSAYERANYMRSLISYTGKFI